MAFRSECAMFAHFFNLDVLPYSLSAAFEKISRNGVPIKTFEFKLLGRSNIYQQIKQISELVNEQIIGKSVIPFIIFSEDWAMDSIFYLSTSIVLVHIIR